MKTFFYSKGGCQTHFHPGGSTAATQFLLKGDFRLEDFINGPTHNVFINVSAIDHYLLKYCTFLSNKKKCRYQDKIFSSMDMDIIRRMLFQLPQAAQDELAYHIWPADLEFDTCSTGLAHGSQINKKNKRQRQTDKKQFRKIFSELLKIVLTIFRTIWSWKYFKLMVL